MPFFGKLFGRRRGQGAGQGQGRGMGRGAGQGPIGNPVPPKPMPESVPFPEQGADSTPSQAPGRGLNQHPEGSGQGPTGECVCPVCGTKLPHQAGVPCYERKCPKCGATMTRAQS